MSEANDNVGDQMDAVQDETANPNRTVKIIAIILIALVLLCICIISIPTIVIAILSLLGPTIGGVFSDIIIGI